MPYDEYYATFTRLRFVAGRKCAFTMDHFIPNFNKFTTQYTAAARRRAALTLALFGFL